MAGRVDVMDPSKSRCAASGSKGRCQLLGSLGHASATGGYWLCAWHDAVINLGESCCLENFTAFIKEQKEYGCDRWNGRTIDAWWALVQGEQTLGCWDWRKIEVPPVVDDTEEKRPGY